MANGKVTGVGDEVTLSHPMNGGDGPFSYSRNSLYQRQALEAAKSLVVESIIEKLDITQNPHFACSKTIKIADFGCSTGPNTFIAVQNILEALEQKYSQSTPHETPEFQVFFIDQLENDFNTLFTTLPPSRPYLATGVPGSFHSRLLPPATLHIAHSSQALNWLSKIPDEVTDKGSPAWNGGDICYARKVKVFESYSKQFKRDMEKFLSARAQEIVGGGIMMLLLPGYEDGFIPIESLAAIELSLLGSCLMDMVNMGLITKDKVDSFNLPLYQTSPMELRGLINANGYFSIEKLENCFPYEIKELPDCQQMAMHLRASIQGLVTQHFGSEIIEELFDRYAEKLAQNGYIFDQINNKEFVIFACLKRKY